VLIAAATFALCAGIILGTYWAFVVRPENRAARALRERLNAKPAERPARGELTKKHVPLSALKIFDAALARLGGLIGPIRRSIAHSGLPITIGVALLACGFVGTVTFVLVRQLTSSAWFGGLAGLAAASLPYQYICLAARNRLKKMEEQLPQAVDMIAVSLRAGHTFTTGLLMVADELANPLGAEFRLLYDQQTYGKPLSDVLKEFAGRVPLLDARIFVTAVLTQRETGGNLAEILDKLATVVRERFRLRRQVRTLSAHGRVTGWVLALLPPALAGILFVVAPSHIMTLIDDPLGRQMVVVAVVLELVGVLTIRRIVNVEF